LQACVKPNMEYTTISENWIQKMTSTIYTRNNPGARRGDAPSAAAACLRPAAPMSALGVLGVAPLWLVSPLGGLGGQLWRARLAAVASTVAALATTAPAAVAPTAVASGGGGWSGWCAAAGRQCLGGMAGHGLCAIVHLRHRGGACWGIWHSEAFSHGLRGSSASCHVYEVVKRGK
jgi:hypothetical protein